MKGVGYAKAPYPLFHMEYSDVVDSGSTEQEKQQGPPTLDRVKEILFKQVRLSLGEKERWIYVTEDTYDRMNRVSITEFHKALTTEWGETSKYWP